MNQKELSRGAIVAVVTAVVLFFGVAFWWRTQPNSRADAYSAGVAKMEQSEAFKRVEAEEAWRQKNPEAAKTVDHLNADKVYQPESGEN